MTILQADNSDLVLGVTGHRSIQTSEQLTDALDHALDAIRTQWPARRIVIVSALAEGADRIIAQHFLACASARLVAALPLTVEAYMEDFPSPQSKRTFQQLLDQADDILQAPPGDGRPQAYAAAGESMLAQSDVLIALWDGEPAAGLGGTGDVVHRARELGLPIVWIRCSRTRSGAVAAKSPDDQAGIRFERFSA